MDLPERNPYVPAPGREPRTLDTLPPPHSDFDRHVLEAGRPVGEPARGGLIDYSKADPQQVFLSQFHVPGQNTGWFNSIYVHTYFRHALGPHNWIRIWVDHVDGVFVMPYRETGPGAHPYLKWTDRSRNDFESAPLGMSSVKHHGVHFIPLDGNLGREIYFWTQVWEGDQWLRHEDRPVRWPR